MKKRLLALTLSTLLLCSGCTSMLERGHVSSTAHVEYSITEDASVLRAENYTGLVNSILYFVNDRATSGTIRLYNYSGDVDTDLGKACDEVIHEDPLGAFAVSTINYDSTRILTYYEVELRFQYSRSASEVAAIQPVVGISGLRQQLAQMVEAQSSRLTLLVSYFSGNEDMVWQLLMLARYAEPALYRDPGGSFSYDISFYPETGTRRIIEIIVNNWGQNRPVTSEEISTYTRELDETCALLLNANPPAGETYTLDELVTILRTAAGGYDYHGTQLAIGTLTGAPAHELGYMLALEALCQRCGIEVTPVFSPPNSWLIVATEDGYRHLLPSDIYAEPVGSDVEQPGAGPAEPQPIPLYTDQELEAQGIYVRNRALYPACEGGQEEPAPTVSANNE